MSFSKRFKDEKPITTQQDELDKALYQAVLDKDKQTMAHLIKRGARVHPKYKYALSLVAKDGSFHTKQS